MIIFWPESRTLDICLRNYLSAVSLTWIRTIPAMPTKKDFSADAYPYSVREGVRRKNLFNEHFLDFPYVAVLRKQLKTPQKNHLVVLHQECHI